MPNIGRRRDCRLRLEIPAKLITLGGTPNLALCDLSQSGARLRMSCPLQVGETGVLFWLNHEAFGQVKWVEYGYTGIEFDELLDPEVLLDTRDAIDQGLAPTMADTVMEAARNWYDGQC